MAPLEMKKLCTRFEIAIENFGRSCLDMRANEKCFQAWFAASVIHEFGMSRVYREVHLSKDDLLDKPEVSPLASKIKKGNELFPDISVSWLPNVDARHSASRDSNFRRAAAMLAQFAIVSELKVTGSSGTHTSPSALRLDLAKLFVFARAQAKAQAPERLSTYLVVLDNARRNLDDFRNHYSREMPRVLNRVRKEWPTDKPAPVVALISPQMSRCQVTFLRDFNSTVDVVA